MRQLFLKIKKSVESMSSQGPDLVKYRDSPPTKPEPGSHLPREVELREDDWNGPCQSLQANSIQQRGFVLHVFVGREVRKVDIAG